jgi:hypothetical protein
MESKRRASRSGGVTQAEQDFTNLAIDCRIGGRPGPEAGADDREKTDAVGNS